MKPQHRILFLFPLFTLLACSASSSLQDDFIKINWLKGYWERVNAKEGRSAHERWEEVSDQELKGWGVSMRGSDTAFMEVLRIVVKDGALHYVADVPENPNPVFFKFTSIDETGFICENPVHDFPKKIEYQLRGDTLKAITSGDGKELVFDFVKASR
ncbi:MAG: DUF6265 family protein [Cyclobacteriaceae bacterium]